MKVNSISWVDVEQAAAALVGRYATQFVNGEPTALSELRLRNTRVWGVPSGGSVIAPYVAKVMGATVVPTLAEAHLIVDDLVDSGRTAGRLIQEYCMKEDQTFDALFRKPSSPKDVAPGAIVKEGWLHFPWEDVSGPEDAVVRLLQGIGEDPTRDGLKGTPGRVVRALREMTSGYAVDPKEVLSTCFEQYYDEMVILRGIEFASMCEHHMLPFVGEVDVGYVPGKVVGLSKLARLVDCFAKRLQIQERMTLQIAEAIREHLDAKGVAVVVRARHSCMGCRGVKKPGAEMVTSAMLGVLREKSEARAEFLALCGR